MLVTPPGPCYRRATRAFGELLTACRPLRSGGFTRNSEFGFSMLVWIDAAHPAARLKVFGLTVTERHLQALMRLEPKPTQVIIDVGSKDPAELRIPDRVLKAL